MLVYLFKKGVECNKNGQYREAIEYFLRANELAPNNVDILIGLSIAYDKIGKYYEEAKALKKCVELEPNTNNIYTWISLAYACDKIEEYDEAIKSLKKCIELEPRDYINCIHLGEAYYKNGQHKESIEPFLKATELEPNISRCWHELGDAYDINGQHEKARESYLKAIEILLKTMKLNSNMAINEKAEYLYTLGDLHCKIMQFEKAIDLYLECLELDPNNIIYLGALANAYFQNGDGDIEQAIKCYLGCLELNPDNVAIWMSLGISYYKLDRYRDAIQWLSKSVELYPNISQICWYPLGSSYYMIGKHKEASEYLTKALELDSDNIESLKSKNMLEIKQKIRALGLDSNNAEGWGLLGFSYYNLGKYADAIQYLTRAIELNTNDTEILSEILRGLGSSYAMLGKYKEAIEYLSKCLKFNPRVVDTWYELGMAYYANGQYKEAKECFSKAIELHPNFDDCRNMIDECNKRL